MISGIGDVQLDGPLQSNGISITLVPARGNGALIGGAAQIPQIATPDLGLCERVQLEYLLRNSLKKMRRQEARVPPLSSRQTAPTMVH